MVTRVRGVTKDDDGDPVGTATTTTLVGAFTAPRLSFDIDGKARDGAVTGLSLFAPYGTDVVRTDLIRVDGEDYRIDGDIGDWTSPLTGWKPGLVADLVRAAG